MRLVAGLRTDPLGELTALPQNPNWIKGGGVGDREEGGGRNVENGGPPNV